MAEVLDAGDRDKFLSAPTDEVVRLAQRGAEHGRRLRQDGIAAAMAVVVVDLLEPIQIQHEQAGGRVMNRLAALLEIDRVAMDARRLHNHEFLQEPMIVQ